MKFSDMILNSITLIEIVNNNDFLSNFTIINCQFSNLISLTNFLYNQPLIFKSTHENLQLFLENVSVQNSFSSKIF